MALVTLKAVKNHPYVIAFIEAADRHMGAVGYTEHGGRHANLVSNIAQNVLSHLGYKKRIVEMSGISGYMHDLGNVISRSDHGMGAALIAMNILQDLKMDPNEIAEIMGAVGNHEEERGDPISEIAAALILADKSDVHRTRVRNPNMATFDIHDRVNYAAEKSFLRVDDKKKSIALELTIDTEISRVMEYFEIFLSRMVISRRAARFLGCKFELIINGTKLF
ncbi:MAG: phosphohydrolase [bacterium]